MSTALKFGSLHVHRFVQEQVDKALQPGRFSFDLARGIWSRSLPGGIEQFISLPTDIAADTGPVVVTANLGVHYRPLAVLLAEQHGRQRAQNLSTFTRNLGQLSARRAWREWIIRTPNDTDRVARRLAARIVAVGLPWLARFDGAAAVCEGFRSFGHEEHRRYVIPLFERLLAKETSPSQTAPPTDVATAGEPTVLSIRIDREEITWHCDE
jgi:hypothetical protein